MLARLVARIPVPRNRLFTVDAGEAVAEDGEPAYSMQLRARLSGAGQPLLRIAVYHFDDSDPTRAPESDLLRTQEELFNVADDGEWWEVTLDLPPDLLTAVGGLEANAVLVYVGLAPPATGASELLVDDVRYLEWRVADELPDAFYAADCVRNTTPGGATITLEQKLD